MRQQQQNFWLISKKALITLPEAGAGRFPVSLGQFGMVLVFSSAGSFDISIFRPTSEEQVKGNHRKGCEEKNDLKESEGLICPCKRALPFHLPEHAP